MSQSFVESGFDVRGTKYLKEADEDGFTLLFTIEGITVSKQAVGME